MSGIDECCYCNTLQTDSLELRGYQEVAWSLEAAGGNSDRAVQRQSQDSHQSGLTDKDLLLHLKQKGSHCGLLEPKVPTWQTEV